MSTIRWRKSSRCMNDSNCVEVAQAATDQLWVRDTKRGVEGPVLQFSLSELQALIERVKQGELDR